MVPAPPVSEKLDMHVKRGLPGSRGIMLLRVPQKAEPERRTRVSAGSLFSKVLPRGVGQEDTPKRVSGWSRLWATGASSPWGPLKSPQNEPQSAPSRAGGCGIHPLTPSPLLKAAPGGTVAWGEGPRQKGGEPGNMGEPPCQPGGDCSTSAAAATRGGCGVDTALVTWCPDNPAMHGRWTTSGQWDGPWTPWQDAT